MKLFITLIFCLMSAFTYTSDKHVIGVRPAGLFSNFFALLAHLDWCERVGKTPVVYWDSQSIYYNRQGYNGAKNVWEYYFEPVSHASFNKGDLIDRNYNAPDNTYLQHGNSFQDALTKEMRHKMNRLITKYIKVKDCIRKKAKEFYKAHIKGKSTIGMHVRRTDNFMARNVQLDEYVRAAEAFPDHQVLIATDDQSALEYFKKKIKNKVIYYDAFRSQGTASIHHHSSYNKASAGEEVIIEVLLLACCDALIYSISHVAGAALYFNPDMESIFLKP